ncbi:hypothetical protein PoB_002613500 [Plakobranchus ocellatus]|uniref:BESS domain-containing protein n=1 Tax=Plakobranchus ocellatus TaxID=259542 RepID=A0AAV3ZWR7_9GAST|nr:hypothetical protein PoB_002613500 [Plakobranchus ocellatus]
MTFLLPHITDNKTSSNLSDISDQEEDNINSTDESQMPQSIDESQILDDGIEAPTVDAPRPTASVDKGKRKRAKFPQERAFASTIDKEIFTAIKNISVTTPRSEPEDEDEFFFKSPIPKMKTLDPITKWELQTELQMLVLRYVKRSGKLTYTSDEGSSRRLAHRPAIPHQGARSSGTPSPVLPYQQPGTSSSSTCFVNPNHTIVPSPILSYQHAGSNAGSTTSADYDYDYEQASSQTN